MDEIVKLADQLGKRIAESERFVNLRQAENAVENDPEAGDLLKKADAHKARLASLEAARKPIEPEDKREMQRLTEAMTNNEKLHALLRAQADYIEMMSKVNEAIRSRLA